VAIAVAVIAVLVAIPSTRSSFEHGDIAAASTHQVLMAC
jgi:hypothetical protein